jgi:hypothetical protein
MLLPPWKLVEFVYQNSVNLRRRFVTAVVAVESERKKTALKLALRRIRYS